MRISELIGSLYIWLIALFLGGRRDQLNQNHIENNNQQIQQQQQQQQQITINVEQQQQQQSPVQQQQQQQPSVVNVYKNIDKKEPISYQVYKKKALDYLKKNENIDTDSVIAQIVQQCQITSTSTQATKQLFSTILDQSIENEKYKYLIINAVFDYMKRTQTQSGEQWLSFLSIIFSTSVTTEKERQDISSILLNLPPAVLGDVQDRSKSRVLVDIYSDMSDALSIDRRKLAEIGGFVEEVSTILITLISSYKPEPAENVDTTQVRFQLLALLLLNLNVTYRSKLLLSNLVMSRILPLQINSRQLFLNNLFSFKGIFTPDEIDINNNNNNSLEENNNTTSLEENNSTTSTTSTTTFNMV